MKYLLRHWLQTGTAILCVSLAACPGGMVSASEIDSMEEQTSDLKDELNSINDELLRLGTRVADLENEIEATDNEIAMAEEQLAIAKRSEEQQFEEMKKRIKYVYENDSATLLSMIFSVDNMAEFLNRIEFVQNISDYDREQLEELQTLRNTIEEEEARLEEEQSSQKKMEQELAEQKAALDEKAKATSADLVKLNSEIEKLREEEARKAAEEAKKAAEASKNQSSSSSSSSGGGYNYPSGEGVLTPEKGVNYFNGHRETYYSQKVLPGHGLNIPGRHVASDGTIRDKDGYICVASSDYPKGTVVETSLGPGKVYDSGCAPGTIDIYTDW